MIINRKKGKSIAMFIFLVPVLLMFFFGGIYAVFEGEIAIGIIFIVITVVGLSGVPKSMMKIISANPEFEITDNDLFIYDNPQYECISIQDMVECNIYSGLYNDYLLGISLKKDSQIRSNLKEWKKTFLNIPEEKSKIVFINLEHSDIKPTELANILNKKISKINSHSKNTGNNT
ncbi:hypothetical protein MATR_04140 [Marivirga tractuosa]|uniref:Uncharacterized protein n=1 Tax=Marivirga tractuosa (strain ATCC 23168 / DSM 4126 / NBRC 15989 / NCIMB 1408 / VKM B-1430 / H-43) TaxID=643867 RepID=E4TTC1_MARTH|nr:hypothetical protein [Marivirga tractuosa]ADR21951.1 hypothetical protein Ftrac_1966 [Marivirga tractuosa DSM 4126]BDD13589.1 hypothetical protein MATR_04140 [Marivirga tractuosa]